MNESECRLEHAGELVRGHVQPAPTDHARWRAELVEACENMKPRRVRRFWVGVLVPAALAGGVAMGVLLRAPKDVIQFTIGNDSNAGTVGAFVTPIGQRESELHFSDGSSVVLEPAARARVVETTPHGARILIEEGRARISVAHRPQAKWVVAAGPYTVDVVGTTFHVGWDGKTAALDLAMHEGVVVLCGPGIEGGTTVRAPERFTTRVVSTLEPDAGTVLVASDRASVTAAGASTTTPAGAVAMPVSPSVLSLPPNEPPPADPVPRTTNTGTPVTSPQLGRTSSSLGDPNAAKAVESWPRLASSGKYADILADADHRGLDKCLATANDAELMALADAARYSGRTDIARRALLAVRGRFTQSIRAATAAFILGRTAEDVGRTSEAVGWYDRYIEEAPSGALAAEALGRAMVARREMGDGRAARRNAEKYLSRFSTGPYAPIARDLAKTP